MVLLRALLNVELEVFKIVLTSLHLLGDVVEHFLLLYESLLFNSTEKACFLDTLGDSDLPQPRAS